MSSDPNAGRRYGHITADECFLGTAAELIPVVAVDGRSIGDGSPARSPIRFSPLSPTSCVATTQDRLIMGHVDWF